MAESDSKQEIISRKEARKRGLKRYFTGQPCHRGHIAERATSGGRCVECNKIMCSKWQKENRDWSRRNWKKNYWANPEKRRRSRNEWYSLNAKEQRSYRREWYQLNIEERRAYLRKRRTDPEILKKHNDTNKKWREANPTYFIDWKERNPLRSKALSKANKQRWRALYKNALGKHGVEDILKIYKLQKGRCAYCRTKLDGKFQVDHITPLSMGGTNFPNNLQLLCENRRGVKSCNQQKRDRDPIDYAQSRGLLL